MNKKQRVIRLIKRDAVDFLPSQIDFTPSNIGRICSHLGIPESEEKLSQYVDNHIVYAYSLSNVEEYLHNTATLDYAIKYNFAKIDKDKHIVIDQWGVGWDYEAEGVWAAVHPLEDLKLYEHYQFPDPNKPNSMDEVNRIVAQNPDNLVLGFQHICLFERAWTLRGYENLMLDMSLNPEFVNDLLDNITNYQVECAKQFVSAGVDAVRIGDDYGLQKGLMVSPKTWRKFFKPRLAKIYKVYMEAGLPVFQHSCGDIRAIIPDLIEIGLSVLHPIQPLAMPIEELAEKYSESIVFFGGIDTQQLLPYGTPDDVIDGVKNCINTLGKKHSYIIAPSQEIMTDVPIKNIMALISAIKQFR